MAGSSHSYNGSTHWGLDRGSLGEDDCSCVTRISGI
jgi:hypothetical protein